MTSGSSCSPRRASSGDWVACLRGLPGGGRLRCSCATGGFTPKDFSGALKRQTADGGWEPSPTTIPPPTPGGDRLDLDELADGRLLITRYDFGALALEPDGGFTMLVPPSERPFAAAVQGAELFYEASCAVFRWTPDGGALVAGGAEQGGPAVDGSLAGARFRFPSRLAALADGGVVIGDGTIRVLTANGVTTVAHVDGGAFMVASFADTFAFTVTRPLGSITFETTVSVGEAEAQLGLFSGAMSDVVGGREGLWGLFEPNGAGPTQLVQMRTGGGQAAVETSADLHALEPRRDEGLWATSGHGLVMVDFDGGTTPFSTESAAQVRVNPWRDELVTTPIYSSGSRGREVRRYAAGATTSSVVAALADTPSDVLVEDAGSLLLAVPGAVLRLSY